ncbi:MAG: DUF447 family protein [Candidatus Bathyarchaeota archaeon]|nr:DUF447 family protein [Candidatus Bathyarchaeota archaeon]
MNGATITEMLDELGFTRNSIVETILVTSSNDGSLNPAPMGVIRLDDEILEIRAFKTSKTHVNLSNGGQASINIVNNPMLFLATAFKDEIKAQPNICEEMSLEEAEVSILVEVLERKEHSDLQVSYMTRPLKIDIKRRRPLVFSRGRARAVEAVIHATRIKVFKAEGLSKDVDALKTRFDRCINTVKHVSSADSEEYMVVEKLVSMMEGWGTKR